MTIMADLFTEAMKRAMAREMTIMDLLTSVGQLSANKEDHLVPTLYRTWIQNNPNDPLIYAVLFNYSVVLSNNNALAEARDALQQAIQVKPDFFPPYINLGSILERMGQTADAVQTWFSLVNFLAPVTGESVEFKLSALKQISRVLETANVDGKAEEILKSSLDLYPDQLEVMQHWLALRQRQCKWPVVVPWERASRNKLMAGFSPLTLSCQTDDPLMQLGCAWLTVKKSVPPPPIHFLDEHPKRLTQRKSDKLRIGYLSSDLRVHALGYLVSEIFELHDRNKVDALAYYTGHQVNDAHHQRFRNSADQFLDISQWPDEQAARRIVEDEIDILVDLNGHTHGSRLNMLSMRPAPIVVNWLGYPGTAGSPFHHYIIGDDFITPPESEIYYSEKVVRLPCYQPNDRKRVVNPLSLTRKDFGLPEDQVVYACFNALHKISPFTWGRWMAILKQMPGSVLWLMTGTDEVMGELKKHMLEHQVALERLIFAPKMANADHLARYALADVFLDTSPYGAHVTGSDAMWMGIPMVTLAGKSFASRVSSSLVTAAGIPELACKSSEEYIALAVELGRNKEKRQEIRNRLRANRDTCTLFDTPNLVRHLEQLYVDMWEDFRQNRLPRPDLANLDVYLDIGAELDRDDFEMGTLQEYHQTYLQKLQERDRLSMLRPDSRLWQGQSEK
ncbi:MAG: glycosyl transferase [Magnetococcales bacterium]|nr:glycosyl transferase [Magnetococcales bacterium]